jgi:uncharacterized membrane protein
MTNRILSWKINNGVYAYIYLPGQNTYLGKKYSDDSSIWQDIIKEVNSEEKYKTHYNKMIAEIKNKYGIVLILTIKDTIILIVVLALIILLYYLEKMVIMH